MNDDELNELDSEEVSNNPQEIDEEVVDNYPEGTNGEEYDTSSLPEGFGKEQYEKTVGNRNYYKDQAGQLRSNLEKARAERAKTTKEVPDKGKIKEEKQKEGKKSSGGEKKAQTGESSQKANPTKTKSKGKLDKARDALNVAKAKKDIVENKVNSAQAKAYQMAHPVEATTERVKAEAKARIKKKLRQLIISHLPLFIFIAAIFLILIVLLLLLAGSSSDGIDEDETMIEHDISTVTVQTSSGILQNGEVLSFETVDMNDFIMGAAYVELKANFDELTNEQKKEVFKTYMIVAKTRALTVGNYDADNPSMNISTSSSGVPYCNVYNGCNVFQLEDGSYLYTPLTYLSGSLPGNFIGKIDPASSSDISLMADAFYATRNLLLVPDSINSEIVNGDFTPPPYTQSIKSGWISNAKNNKDYNNLIADTPEYEGYKIYDQTQYATVYNYASSNSFWWPVGSESADSEGLYSGTPTAQTITYGFGPRTIEGVYSNHGGIDISGGNSQCSMNPIIAAADGTVTTAVDGCDSVGYYGNTCNGGFGNYVMIDHGNGITTVYGHMSKGSITVSSGTNVRQGQMIGLMGSSGSSTGCHLHFEVRVNNSQTNPADYVSVENPRPQEISSGFEAGSNVQQTVCRSLLASNFSSSATAAIMANMSAESGFNLGAIGDSGSSYGLCQWHDTRWTDLQNYCNSNGLDWHSVEGQFQFFLYEFNTYPGLVNYFSSPNSARDMAEKFCIDFERPAQAFTTCANRANSRTATYEAYVRNGCN